MTHLLKGRRDLSPVTSVSLECCRKPDKLQKPDIEDNNG